jgi:hypothetical protein
MTSPRSTGYAWRHFPGPTDTAWRHLHSPHHPGPGDVEKPPLIFKSGPLAPKTPTRACLTGEVCADKGERARTHGCARVKILPLHTNAAAPGHTSFPHTQHSTHQEILLQKEGAYPPRSVVYGEDVSAPGIVTPGSACQTSLQNLQKDSEQAREREKRRERESENAGGWW